MPNQAQAEAAENSLDMMPPPDNATRRAFLVVCARWSAMAGLAGVAAHLLMRPGLARTCGKHPGCNACPVFMDCSRPGALARRRRAGQ